MVPSSVMFTNDTSPLVNEWNLKGCRAQVLKKFAGLPIEQMSEGLLGCQLKKYPYRLTGSAWSILNFRTRHIIFAGDKQSSLFLAFVPCKTLPFKSNICLARTEPTGVKHLSGAPLLACQSLPGVNTQTYFVNDEIKGCIIFFLFTIFHFIPTLHMGPIS